MGIDPVEVVGENDFGNLMIKDTEGKFWRLCPEELYCKIVADDSAALKTLSNNQDFLKDWYMSALVELAKASLGPLGPGRKYCLAIPGVLGGRYDASNIKSVSVIELIGFSGDVAEQICDLPDGQTIELRVIE